MTKNTITFGEYSTNMTVIKHSAVASWSGFVYQGLCGLHYALHLLNKDFDKVRNWKLNYEAYEDFSILDDCDLIVSMHQCKCVNATRDFTDECQKMKDKEEYWSTKEPLLSDSYKGLFFHSNQTNTYSCEIKSYDYETSNKLCNPSEIYSLIETEIERITKAYYYPGSCKSKLYRLTSMVSKHIESLHETQIKTKKGMFYISRSKSIGFSCIIDELNKDDEPLGFEEKAITCRHYLEMSMRMRLLTCPRVYGTKVDDFLTALLQLDMPSLESFVKRIFPDIYTSSNDADLYIRSIERADYLFNVINEVNYILNLNTFDWNTSAGETPSTLGSNKYPEEFCKAIIDNPDSASIRRDYNWIVGDIRYKIDDIDTAGGSIILPDGIDHDDITQPRKIGLLDINTKNNGKY